MNLPAKIENISDSCKAFERFLQFNLTYTLDSLETPIDKGFQAQEVSR